MCLGVSGWQCKGVLMSMGVGESLGSMAKTGHVHQPAPGLGPGPATSQQGHRASFAAH